MVLVEEEDINHHPELATELTGIETGKMIPGKEVAEN